MSSSDTLNPPLFAILNEIDGPYRKMVVQWCHDRGGYCYLHRGDGKSRYDGMQAGEMLGKPTPIEDFGFDVDLSYQGVVLFERTRESRATYKDGKPRNWADRCTKFGFALLEGVR